MQRLLNSYDWDAGAVRDALARYVVASAGHPAAVLVADETGFLKKGRRSAGVQRQYTGTAGRVENCQVGVFLAYATPDGSRALIDRELYVPTGWIADPDRCAQAGVPGDAQFATKPALARQMVEQALEAEVPFGWFAGDEVYGQNPGLRDWLEERHIPFITDSNGNELIPLTVGEARRLFSIHAATARPPGHHLRWSLWRRRHQARARKYHYQRRQQLHHALML